MKKTVAACLLLLSAIPAMADADKYNYFGIGQLIPFALLLVVVVGIWVCLSSVATFIVLNIIFSKKYPYTWKIFALPFILTLIAVTLLFMVVRVISMFGTVLLITLFTTTVGGTLLSWLAADKSYTKDDPPSSASSQQRATSK